MLLNMPKLVKRRIYERADVEPYIGSQTGTGDYDVFYLHFPRSPTTWTT